MIKTLTDSSGQLFSSEETWIKLHFFFSDCFFIPSFCFSPIRTILRLFARDFTDSSVARTRWNANGRSRPQDEVSKLKTACEFFRARWIASDSKYGRERRDLQGGEMSYGWTDRTIRNNSTNFCIREILYIYLNEVNLLCLWVKHGRLRNFGKIVVTWKVIKLIVTRNSIYSLPVVLVCILKKDWVDSRRDLIGGLSPMFRLIVRLIDLPIDYRFSG